MIAAVRVLALLSALAAAGDPVKTSSHYSWRIHGDCPEVPELMKVAEALWGPLSAHFGARPPGKLEVEYYEKGADYLGAVTEGGPTGTYRYDDGKVHQPRGARPWDTRQALISNLVDQFMSLAVRARGKPIPTWYRAGLMCHFSLHRWDGRLLVTGVDDDPAAWGRSIAKFAADAKEGKWDPMDAVDSDSKMYIEAWTAVHFLLSGADRGATARFKALERKMWDGMEARESATALLGADPKRIRKSAGDWIVALPRPWLPIRDIWERTAEDGFAGEPYDRNPDALLVRDADPGAAPFAEATVQPEAGAEGGVLLGYGERTPYFAAFRSANGRVRVVRKSPGDSGLDLAFLQGSPGDAGRLRIEAAGNVLRVLLAGKEIYAFTGEEGTSPGAGKAGLLASGGKVRFSGVRTADGTAGKR